MANTFLLLRLGAFPSPPEKTVRCIARRVTGRVIHHGPMKGAACRPRRTLLFKARGALHARPTASGTCPSSLVLALPPLLSPADCAPSNLTAAAELSADLSGREVCASQPSAVDGWRRSMRSQSGAITVRSRRCSAVKACAGASVVLARMLGLVAIAPLGGRRSLEAGPARRHCVVQALATRAAAQLRHQRNGRRLRVPLHVARWRSARSIRRRTLPLRRPLGPQELVPALSGAEVQRVGELGCPRPPT
jgi:hypothetical protein